MTARRAGMLALRYGLPLALLAIGIVAIAVGGGADGVVAGAGVMFLGIALMVWMLGWMFRMSLESNRDREREEDAREYFTRHGRWPDEDDR